MVIYYYNICVSPNVISGPSKKKAKHNAALSVLNQMTGMTNGTQAATEDYGYVVRQCQSVTEHYG